MRLSGKNRDEAIFNYKWLPGSGFGWIIFYPFITGILLGLSLVAAFYIQGSAIPQIPGINVAASSLLKAFWHGLAFNLIPIFIVMVLVTRVFRVKNKTGMIYWIFATVFSMAEPVFMAWQALSSGLLGSIGGSLVLVEIMIIANLVAFAFLKSRGLVPMLIMRLGIGLCLSTIML